MVSEREDADPLSFFAWVAMVFLIKLLRLYFRSQKGWGTNGLEKEAFRQGRGRDAFSFF